MKQQVPETILITTEMIWCVIPNWCFRSEDVKADSHFNKSPLKWLLIRAPGGGIIPFKLHERAAKMQFSDAVLIPSFTRCSFPPTDRRSLLEEFSGAFVIRRLLTRPSPLLIDPEELGWGGPQDPHGRLSEEKPPSSPVPVVP